MTENTHDFYRNFFHMKGGGQKMFTAHHIRDNTAPLRSVVRKIAQTLKIIIQKGLNQLDHQILFVIIRCTLGTDL
jgi:hypothetical protein